MCPLNTVMLQWGGAGEDQEEPDDVPNDAATGEAAEDQEEPDNVPMMMISAGSLSMQGHNAKVKRRS